MSATEVDLQKLTQWPKFVEYIRDMNAQGYLDRYIPSLKCAVCFGEMTPEWEYIVVSITDNKEICAIGLKTIEAVEQHLATPEGAWIVKSLWHNGTEMKFKITRRIVVEIESNFQN